MDENTAKQSLDKVVAQVLGYQNPYTLEQFQQKFAFDVRLPIQVNDSTDGTVTWAQSANPARFITLENARKRSGETDWMVKPRQLNSIEEILAAWQSVNLTSTERQIDSEHFARSDNVYNSQYVYHSHDIHRSKYVLFSDAVLDSEYVVASQRSHSLSYCIRAEDSKESSNCFSVSWSAKVGNSYFIHDCYDVYESMFCSHIASKRFCVANMQFDETEYKRLKEIVAAWILTAQ